MLDERFVNPTLDPRLSWRCEPARWQLQPGRLRVEPDAETDFWQRTHYGFQVDNGHFLFAEVAGPFRLATQVRFEPAHQYDQAGLMVRLSADCWLKTSVEHEPGPINRLGVVVTNAGYSDWSTQDVPGELREIWLRLERTGRGLPGRVVDRWVELVTAPPGPPARRRRAAARRRRPVRVQSKSGGLRR